MKIKIENDWLEFEPESDEEAKALAKLSVTVLDAARADRKMVPQSDYLPCLGNALRLMVRDR